MNELQPSFLPLSENEWYIQNPAGVLMSETHAVQATSSLNAVLGERFSTVAKKSEKFPGEWEISLQLLGSVDQETAQRTWSLLVQELGNQVMAKQRLVEVAKRESRELTSDESKEVERIADVARMFRERIQKISNLWERKGIQVDQEILLRLYKNVT